MEKGFNDVIKCVFLAAPAEVDVSYDYHLAIKKAEHDASGTGAGKT